MSLSSEECVNARLDPIQMGELPEQLQVVFGRKAGQGVVLEGLARRPGVIAFLRPR